MDGCCSCSLILTLPHVSSSCERSTRGTGAVVSQLFMSNSPMLPPQLGKSFSGFVKGYGGQCLNKAREAHPHARLLGWRTAAKAAGRLYTCQPSLHETGASSTERLGSGSTAPGSLLWALRHLRTERHSGTGTRSNGIRHGIEWKARRPFTGTRRGWTGPRGPVEAPALTRVPF